ncbi:hypothetical protein XENTR_v10011903 [Xenopus tropicalis]|uniref:OMA1 zinc metallopeptidase n=1 Tax=Xenopus tropicalis TaxID=8364 RepID=A0A6I8SA96_XENTR|nr:uncharacterized protein LOC101733192 [Xenopus tropicalis]KAE8609752.1 hypothetical protein XENTR_v10011903 [Xenopus tropicalis]
MARNEEKQHGRLNRLWLQKAKEEGHIKDINSNRPRLSALHTASDVKKWIPSIKNEIEYYLEQSQLTHYSERKIKDFQDKIETLKKEYQSYLWKLRRLDPSCKDHPWKLRGYKRKRTEEEKVPSWVESGYHTGAKLLCTPILNDFNQESYTDSEEETSTPDKGEDKATRPDSPNISLDVQDKPLIFDSKKSHPKHLWLRSTYSLSARGTNQIKDILLSNNPELKGTSSMPTSQEDTAQGPVSGGKLNGILGLDCYTSSEDDS